MYERVDLENLRSRCKGSSSDWKNGVETPVHLAFLLDRVLMSFPWPYLLGGCLMIESSFILSNVTVKYE